MNKKNILLLCGGGSPEHDISLISANYLHDQLLQLQTSYEIQVCQVEIKKNGTWHSENFGECYLDSKGTLKTSSEDIFLHFAIPALHGRPGESGEIQGLFEISELPYLGCGPEASAICFNKLSTKLWLDALQIPSTPYVFLVDDSEAEIKRATKAFTNWKDVFVKATNQGSSLGIFHVTEADRLEEAIKKAAKLSPYILVEQNCKERELEASVYTYKGEVKVSDPGEIVSPSGFYDYDEKYSKESKVKTIVKADVSDQVVKDIKTYSQTFFKALKLRHLSRIDFFLTKDGKVLFNECNTFPGHTSISMFPKMMESEGVSYKDFLQQIIEQECR